MIYIGSSNRYTGFFQYPGDEDLDRVKYRSFPFMYSTYIMVQLTRGGRDRGTQPYKTLPTLTPATQHFLLDEPEVLGNPQFSAEC